MQPYTGLSGLSGLSGVSGLLGPGGGVNPGGILDQLLAAGKLFGTIIPAEALAAGGLWMDAAKTVPAEEDGDRVRVATCPYTGVDFVAPSSGARPTLTDAGDGRWSLVFDGVDDYLFGGSVTLAAADPVCVAAAFFHADPGGIKAVASVGSAATGGTRSVLLVSGNHYFGGYDADAVLTPYSAPHTVQVVRVSSATTVESSDDGAAPVPRTLTNPLAAVSAKPMYAGRLVNDATGYVLSGSVHGAVFGLADDFDVAAEIGVHLSATLPT